jgi:DNA primase
LGGSPRCLIPLLCRAPGKNLVGLCPFHKEENPSLTVTPSTNKWRCFGCGKGGTVIDWVMHTEGISVSHALQLLRRDLVPTAPTSAGPPPKLSTVPKLSRGP